ncbi:M10 family metallopeptidase C-terminal domain-containing protein [Rhodobacteraceae bacterium DSL-40]|uniref:calcium-binding protein n=1 Tax=Amaricoccus sp. B4 TaxID=3368557 RepID=UPI000DADC541
MSDDFQIGPNGRADRTDVQVLALRDGGFVVAYAHRLPGLEETYDVRASVFDSGGNVLRSEFRVNSSVSNDERAPRLAALEDGGFIVGWTSSDPDKLEGRKKDGYLRLFDADGSARTSEIAVTPEAKRDYSVESVAQLSDGSILAMTARSTSAKGYDLIARQFGLDGEAIKAKTIVSNVTGDLTAGGYIPVTPAPQVAALRDGGYTVIWTGEDPRHPGGGQILFSESFSTGGAARGRPHVVQGLPDAGGRFDALTDRLESRIVANDDGFATAWQSEQDFDDSGDVAIYFRRLDSDGIPLGRARKVSDDGAVGHSLGQVIDIGHGESLVTYTAERHDVSDSSATYYEIRGRLYSDDGRALGRSFAISSDVYRNVFDSDTALLKSGLLLSVWSGGSLVEQQVYGNLPSIKPPIAPATRRGDLIVGTKLAESIAGGKGNDTLFGNDGGDVLAGDSGRDRLSGEAGDDTLFGGKGDDALTGAGGADYLVGGEGRDELTGGRGADVFYFFDASESVRRSPDRIMDFGKGADLVDLHEIDAVRGVSGNQAFVFVGGDKFSGIAGELRLGEHTLAGDLDGDRKADFLVVFDEHAKVGLADLIL